ncbi:MAG: acyl carrier protein [Lentisphaeria bacterium]|nr:acyl carrier protein [Lentisphaeria bacterium]
MDDATVVKTINESLATEFEIDLERMVPEAHLIEDLEFDSLDFVDMVVVLQKAFGVKLRNEPKVREIRLLGDLHKLILEKKRELEQQQSES